jgi:uncharacterized protein (DUF924 family)
MSEPGVTPQDIINFWYASDISTQWFNSTQSLDMRILNEYESLWQQARDGKLESWQFTPEGCLALAIILDQFPLNMFRGKPESFSTESKAIEVSKWAISRDFDKQLPTDQVAFLYMPLMHSENMDDQNLSAMKFEAAGLKNNARFSRHHRGIVERFGRFPHRNKILGRESSQEEIDWLASDEAFTG